MLTFPSAPHHVRHPLQDLSELRKSTFFFRGKNSTLWLFSNLSPCFWCVTSLTSPGPISYLGFYFDTCEWCVLSVCTWTPTFMLHLTNPCAKQNVLSLTKPKGKIYKMKSLGHYITQPKTSPSSLWNNKATILKVQNKQGYIHKNDSPSFHTVKHSTIQFCKWKSSELDY